MEVNKIMAALGVSLFVVGLTTLVIGGIMYEKALYGFIGSMCGLIGLAILAKKA